MGLATWAALVAFIAQGIKGVIGFGSALVAVPLVAMLYGPTEAIFLAVSCDAVAGLYLTWTARKQVIVPVVLALLLPALLGQYVGSALLMHMPVQQARLAVALGVGVFGLRMLWTAGRESAPDGPVRSGGWGLPWGGLAGLTGGLMAGLFGAGGPPVVAYAHRFFEPSVARAQMIATFFPAALALCLTLWWRGGVGDDAVAAVPALVVAGLVGGVIGERISRYVAPSAAVRVVGLVIVASAAMLARGA